MGLSKIWVSMRLVEFYLRFWRPFRSPAMRGSCREATVGARVVNTRRLSWKGNRPLSHACGVTALPLAREERDAQPHPHYANPHNAEKNAEPRANPRFTRKAMRRQVRRVRIVRTFAAMPVLAPVVIALPGAAACAPLKTRAYSRRFGRRRLADRLISVRKTPAGGADAPSRGKDEL